MSRTNISLPVLNALIDAATSPQRFENRSHLAVAAGINASSLSLVSSGKRGVSEHTLAGLAQALGVSTDVLREQAPLDLPERVDAMAAEVVAALELVKRLTREVRDLRQRVAAASQPSDTEQENP